MKAKQFLTGVMAGAVTGFAVTLATAPQSGKHLRTNLKNNAISAKHQLLDVKEDTANVKNSIIAFTNEAKNNIPQIINELKNSFSTFKETIEPETNHLKQEIENLQNSISLIENNLSDLQKSKSKNKESNSSDESGYKE